MCDSSVSVEQENIVLEESSSQRSHLILRRPATACAKLTGLRPVIYWLLPEQSRVDTYRATRLERDFDDSHENLYLCLNIYVTLNYQIHDILATRMGCSGL